MTVPISTARSRCPTLRRLAARDKWDRFVAEFTAAALVAAALVVAVILTVHGG